METGGNKIKGYRGSAFRAEVCGVAQIHTYKVDNAYSSEQILQLLFSPVQHILKYSMFLRVTFSCSIRSP